MTYTITSILIALAFIVGYFIGKLDNEFEQAEQTKKAEKIVQDLENNPIQVTGKMQIGGEAPILTNGEEEPEQTYGAIHAPTAEDIERKNRPQQQKDTESAIEDTLDDLDLGKL